MKFNRLASFTSLFQLGVSDELTSMYKYILIGQSWASVVVWHQFQWCHYFTSSVTSTSSWTHRHRTANIGVAVVRVPDLFYPPDLS